METALITSAARLLRDQLADIAHSLASPPPVIDQLRDAIAASCVACRQFEETASARELLAARQEFRATIGPWFDQSWFMHRAKTKPRGYPGDFELLEAIYAGVAKSHGLGEALDRYFLSTILARGVVGRKDVIAAMLDEAVADSGAAAVLDIAAGPCREVCDAPRFMASTATSFTALDHDADALTRAGSLVMNAGFRGTWTQRRYNALRMMSARRNESQFSKYDLLYSIGLFDYLPDDAVVGILAGTRPLLNERGKWVVSFKDIARYQPTEYAWHVDWVFQPRTEAECLNLIARSGHWAVSSTRDVSGVAMVFTLRQA